MGAPERTGETGTTGAAAIGWARVEAWLSAAVVALAALHVLVPVGVFLARFRHPFENSWLEALVLEHVQRLAAGQPLFAPPRFDFVALIYAPLYYHAGALLAGWFGDGFAPLRVLSMASSLASMAIIGLFVRRECGTTLPAVAAAGLFAATYKASGFWFDLARVDNLMLALLLAGLYVTRFGASTLAAVAGGMLLGAAVLTKQTAIAVAAPVLLWAIAVRRGPGVVQAVAAVAVVAVVAAAWQTASDGWFGYYAVELPSRHGIIPGMVAHGLTDLLPLPLAIGFLFSAYFLAWSVPARGARVAAFYALVAASAVLGSITSLAKWAAYANALLPAHAAVALLFGLGFDAVRRDLAGVPGPSATRLRTLASLAVAWQLAALLYNPLPAIPGAQDRERGEALVDALKRMPGAVYFPDQPYLVALAGKPRHAHQMQITDVLLHGDARSRAELLADIERAAASGRIVAAIAHPDEAIPPGPTGWAAFAMRYREAPDALAPHLLRVRMDAGQYVESSVFLPAPSASR